jgi:predicted metal-dependent HD superfamily phosphohydrolase
MRGRQRMAELKRESAYAVRVEELIRHFREDPRFRIASERAIEIMKTTGLDYHNEAHALHVEKYALTFAIGEGVAQEQLPLLALAALFHDTGYVVVYDHNEPEGAKIAEVELRKVGYSESEIQMVKDMIVYGTTCPQKPRNMLERIMTDADLAFVGVADSEELTEALRREMRVSDRRDWLRWETGWMDRLPECFTKTARDMLGARRAEHVKRLDRELRTLERQ